MPGIADQYRIIERGAGWRRRVERGRLRFDGVDRHTFLQALLTNDVGALATGQRCYAAYLTPQGRMIADLHIFAREDHFIADVSVADAPALASTFDKLIFTEQVEVTDVSSALAQFTIVGGEAAAIVPESIGFVVRTDDTKLPSYDLVVPKADEARAIEALEAAGAIEITREMWTALRIDAGRPEFGVDMDIETIPLEAGIQDRAISTTKGCYVGQEVIIRVLHRGGGRVARRLVKLALDSVAQPENGTIVRTGDRDVGRITSSASSLDESHTVALAYVHRDFATSGLVLSVDRTGSATVIGLAG